MAGALWRETTVRILSEKIGPQASSVVDRAMAQCGLTEDKVTAVHFVDLVRVLYDNLPPSVDRRELCRSVTASILAAYGFPSATR